MASLWWLLISVILSIAVTFGLSVLILWLVFITHKIKFYVTDAKLTQFNFTNNQLNYSLSLFISVRNPNEQVGIFYDTIEATAMYKDQKLDTRLLTPFYQSQKATSLLRTRFEGQRLVLLCGEKLGEFNSEKLSGVYAIDVKLHLRMRLKFGLLKIVKVKPKVGCGFKVPLSSNVSSVPFFETTDCNVDY